MYSVQSPHPAGSTSVASVSTDVIPAGYTAIYTAEDLNNVRNKLDGKYILMNDIDLSSIANWEPIGRDTSFTGTFDGNGHVIKNLKINNTDAKLIGFFATTSSSATIKNLGLENIDIKAEHSVGGLVSSNEGTITNCYVTGNISGKDQVGGLVSSNAATITNCYVSGNIAGETGIGGITASSNGAINNCYVTGSVSGNDFVGGLVGNTIGATINDCYVNANTFGNIHSGLICGALERDTKFTNTWANKKNSSLNTFCTFEPDVPITINNCDAISHEEFTTHEFWDKQNLDSDVWEMSYAIPPILKGVGGHQGNWYFKRGDNETRLQVGEGSDPAANALFVNSGLDVAGINIDLSTVEGCLDAVNCVKSALDAVTQKTADIGIAQSRLETISDVNTTKIENLTAAYSTVTEADVAEEVANFTKSQIMAQTAASLITQTQNFHANMVLRMIGSLG